MSGNGFYILIFILLLLFIIPAEVLLKSMLFGLIFLAIIFGIGIYKFNKVFKKFKQQQSGFTESEFDTSDESVKGGTAKPKSITEDEFDLSKKNVIDTDYEEIK